MSNDALSSAQFSGVLHGVDPDGSKYSMPYEARSKAEVLDAGRILTDEGVKITEHSHEGNCEQAGCKF